MRPSAVVERAAQRAVRALALTDHDEVSGLAEARSAAEKAGIELINGGSPSPDGGRGVRLREHVTQPKIQPKQPKESARVLPGRQR